MNSKIKSFLVAIIYMIVGFAVQISVALVGGIIVAIKYFAKQDPQTLDISTSEQIIAVSNEIMGSMNYILLVSSVVTVLVFILIHKIRKKNISEEILLKQTKPLNYCIALLLGVSVWIFNIGFVSLLSESGLFQGSFASMEEAMSFIGDTNILLSILVVGIVAPFAEEFLFRGMIYKTLNKSMSITATIIIQGILFGVYHMNFVQGLYASFLGILFGYITYKTKSLWPAIIMHMINNIVATVAPLILGDSFETIGYFVMFLVLGFVITVIGTLLINKNNPKLLENTNIEA